MWYLIISTRKASMDQVKQQTADHFAWMQEQHRLGTVIISGPTPDRSKGIYVVKAASSELAKNIADQDPFHLSQVRAYELLPWEVHQMLGIGPFSLPGIQHLAHHDPGTHYTDLPKK